jgi:tRNA(Ile)-lysidine synthase
VFEQATERFVAAITDLVPDCDGSTKFALAVSGGPDSITLLLLGNAAFPGQIIAATVDHGLRPEAADEAEFVATLCAERAIPHRILRPAQPIAGNIQSAARQARYALLQEWAQAENADVIITAHHGNDQLETLLMRIIRGSGVDGLASIRARNGNIIRPLLGFNKSELETVCDDQGVEPVHDPSNDDTDFDRVRIRKWLEETDHPFDAAAANRSTKALAQASDALRWVMNQIAADRITTSIDGIIAEPSGLPRELQRRLLMRALSMISPEYAPRGDAIEHCLDSLLTDKTVTLGAVLCCGGQNWHFRTAPPRRTG